MKREILFRGKDVNTGEWFEGDIITNPNNGAQDCILELKGKPRRFTSIDPETIGQFTGLTDKNGVKIFEGDILTYTDVYSKVLLPVSFLFGKFMKQEIRPDSHKWLHTSDHWFDLSFAYERNEVIGNIY